MEASGVSLGDGGAAGQSSSPSDTDDAEADAAEAIQSINSKAQRGDLNYQDFLAMGQTFLELDGKLPDDVGGKMSAKEVREAKAKMKKHERIIQVMAPEERLNPDLLRDDLDDVENKCPRIQRLARDSGISERDVALFVGEFEAMRETNERIAAGEDPDEVQRTLGQSKTANRNQRRAAKKMQRKLSKKG